jgi:tryptophan 2,3-dioxygenase
MGYTYTEYLHLPRLLDLQEPRAVPAVHDELLFVTMHQTCELWFRQILVELEDARDRMLAGEVVLPTRRLARCRAIEALLVHQFDVLDTMPAQEFARFRDVLGDGNGGQSAQYAEILMLSGAKDAARGGGPWHSEQERERLRRRADEPTVWDGFLAALAGAGWAVDDQAGRAEALGALASGAPEHAALWALAQTLLEHDQGWALWQARHVLTAQRQIGGMPGTGRTSGVEYLARRQALRFYPDLWELPGSLSEAG